jgi:outer membrane protein TolC
MKKNILIAALIFTALLLHSQDASGDESGKNIIKLDVETAVSKALINNLNLKNTDIDYKNKILSLATVWNQFIPSTTTQTSISQSQLITTTGTTSSNNLNVGIDSTFSVGLSGKSILNIYQSVLDYQSGKITYEQAKKKLDYDVRKSYFNLVLLNDELDLLQKQIDASKSTYEITLAKSEKGMISEIDKLKSEYSYKSLLPTYKTKYNDFISAMLSFKNVIGLSADNNIEFSDKIPEMTELGFEKITDFSINNNHDIKTLNQTLKTSENTRNLYIAALFPSLDFSYTLSSQFDKDFTKNGWYNNLSIKDWSTTGSLVFSASIPIDSYFPFSSTQVGIIQSQNNVEKSKNTLQNTIETTKNSVTADVLKLKQIEESYNSLEINSDIAERTYDLVNRSYQAGTKNYLDLVDAKNNLFDSKVQLLEAKYNYLSTFLDLKYLLNK